MAVWLSTTETVCFVNAKMHFIGNLVLIKGQMSHYTLMKTRCGGNILAFSLEYHRFLNCLECLEHSCITIKVNFETDLYFVSPILFLADSFVMM